MTQTVHEGLGSLEQLVHVLDGLGAASCFLVRGWGSYENADWRRRLERMLESRRVRVFVCDTRIPTAEQAQRAASAFWQAPCDAIVGIGGGSVLDTAKGVVAFGRDPLHVLEYVRGECPFEALRTPWIAIPTTAGSGSEATRSAVVYVGTRKYSIEDALLLPKVVILDPSLTFGLPAYLTASSGCDVLSQAIESLWSVASTEQSRSYAYQALTLGWKHLAEAVHAPSQENRAAMLLAAHLSGKAINISHTTACHALSYGFTARFGVRHGHAVALTLPALLVFNAGVTSEDVGDPRGLDHVRAQMEVIITSLNAATPAEARQALERLLDNIGLVRQLSCIGVSEADCEILAAEVNEQRLRNNPRRLGMRAIQNIVLELLHTDRPPRCA